MAATEQAIERDAATAAPKAGDGALDEAGAEHRWDALAGGLRTLKLAMEAQSNQERQQRLYRYELKARLRQPSARWWERRAAALYGLGSDYGASIIRPFMARGILIVLFAALY